MRGIFLFAVLFLALESGQALSPAVGAYSNFYNFNVVLTIPADMDGDVLKGYCNGSIIDKLHVVTSAHCFIGATKYLDQASVTLSEYRTKILNNGTAFRAFYNSKTIRIRSVRVLPSAELIVGSGQGSLGSPIDMALVELNEPIDLSAHKIQPIPLVSAAEYNEIKKNPGHYSFESVTTNVLAYVTSLDTRQKTPFFDILIDNKFKNYMGNFIWTFNRATRVEGADSGGPLLVYINGTPKLIGVIKGILEYLFLPVSAFTPLAPNWCTLTRFSAVPRPDCK